jgi:hypothetical protein
MQTQWKVSPFRKTGESNVTLVAKDPLFEVEIFLGFKTTSEWG